ncbi:hypothetical protein ROA7450_01003 [Roseovarius albus]|uniref:Uncharacterized protein n=1 Tax=Roseovarius albus TaxID=1247867 RepID=A0A1X6YLW7_9RHOB|nr:hypothetical protein [Roseovarius albus]SLN24610.1 hypothetical protein ROA7450_01003 [Roseovarius albus]
MTSESPIVRRDWTRPTRRMVLGGSAAGMATLLAGCWPFSKTVTRNIRVTIQADVAGEIVEGSAVMGIRWIPGHSGQMYIKSNAEAVILDLPGRGTVYVLNAWIGSNGRPNGGVWPAQLLETFGMNANGRLEDFPMLRTLEGRYTVKAHPGGPTALPVMVAFEDESKLETMYQVKPEAFPEVFGADVRYVGMWFEFTGDDPTRHIPVRLPVALTPNKSFYTAFPSNKDENGLIPDFEYAFPQKFSERVFYMKGY